MASWRSFLLCLALAAPAAHAADAPPAAETAGDRMLAAYFRAETAKLAAACLADVKTKQDWTARRDEYRKQLAGMLGLDPMPPRTDLKAAVTGTVDHAEFTVEKLHFQSRPGLYVTANLYLPKNRRSARVPGIVYGCGHGKVEKDGVIYGNKVAYQHHGIWFARHGYACLVLDTLQLGEVAGVHHGTHNLDQWWWLSRGYTPAGVEAWNCIRAVDYLQSRPEVDGDKIGVTGRSGGGAYSWWLAALDERVKVAVPVAGITDLHNHVVDGAVEGHCDCMFAVNTYGWDYPQVAALVAPRPLLLVNTDKDKIFPLDGVMRTHAAVRRVYDLLGAGKEFGPTIGEGGHVDTQELQVAAFRWFDRKLAGLDERVIDKAAVKLFEPQQLKVFPVGELPPDAINAKVQETFVPAAPAPAVPKTKEAWAALRDGWMAGLRDKCFRAWPAEPPALDVRETPKSEHGGATLRTYEYTSEEHVRLNLYVLTTPGAKKPDRAMNVEVLGEADWPNFVAALRPVFGAALPHEMPAPAPSPTGGQNKNAGDGGAPAEGVRHGAAAGSGRPAAGGNPFLSTLFSIGGTTAFVVPRGVGPTALTADVKERRHVLRRFALLGRTLESTQVWDVRRALQALRTLPAAKQEPRLRLRAGGTTAGLALYASLFEPVADLTLTDPPATHADGPHFLNVLRVLDLPQAAAMAAERAPVRVWSAKPDAWRFATETAGALTWPDDWFRAGDKGD